MNIVVELLSDAMYNCANCIIPAFVLDSFIVLFYKVIWAPVFLYECFALAFSFFFMMVLNAIPSISLHIVDWIDAIIINRYTALTRRVHLPKHRAPKKFTPSISFMGGGQLWMYSIGVGHYVYEHFDIDKIKFLASSAGTFAAVPLACGRDPYDWCKRDWEKCIRHFESRGLLGCLFDTKQFYYDLWNDYLPRDEDGILPDGRVDPTFVPVHVRCSGRLFISVTLFPSLKNKVVSHFDSRSDLIWTIVASMCLPFAFIRDFPVRCAPSVGWCVDGGFSNDSPCLDTYTITVSALHAEADVQCIAAPHQLRAERNRLRNKKTGVSGQFDGNKVVASSSAGSRGVSSSSSSSPSKRGRYRSPVGRSSSEQAQNDSSGSDSDTVERLLRRRRKRSKKKRSAASTLFVIDGDASDDMDRDGEGDSRSCALGAGSGCDSNNISSSDSDSSDSEHGHNDCVFGDDLESDLEECSEAAHAAAVAAEDAEADALYHYALSHRIRPIDIIRTPSYERVWQVGYLGQVSASRCEDFDRHEWVDIRRKVRPPAPVAPM